MAGSEGLTSQDERASHHHGEAENASGADGAAGVLIEELLDRACPLLHLARRLLGRLPGRLLGGLLRLLRWCRGLVGKLGCAWQVKATHFVSV